MAISRLLAVPLTLLAAVTAPDHSVAAARQDYIVLVKAGAAVAPATAAAAATALGGEVRYVYEHAVQGFAVSLTAAQHQQVSALPFVGHVEPDAAMHADTTQTGAPWGLDRIDQRDWNWGFRGSYTYNATGSGVTAYIIDTGIRYTHRDFGGRAVRGYDAITPGGDAGDCAGHGTHVAGTVGGTTYGVAKRVRLVSVRVLNCFGSGSVSSVIAGVDWVTGAHTTGPAVANMSLGGPQSTALDAAVQRSIADGVSYAVSAGNADADACGYSPAGVPEALTTGATDSSDNAPEFSNHGRCVDWYAPGVDILSASASGDTASETMSGTSMASPHTAGVAAMFLQGQPAASPSTVRSVLSGYLSKGVVGGAEPYIYGNGNLLHTGGM